MSEITRLIWTDDDLLSGLAEGSDKALSQLYRQHYPMVSHLVLSNSGSAEDARLRSQLVVRFTTNARSAFAKQDLDGSIRQWDRVLSLDPSNETAKPEGVAKLARYDRPLQISFINSL